MRSKLVAGTALGLLAVLSVVVVVVRRDTPTPSATEAPASMGAPLLDPDQEIAYVCPIHPDYTSRFGGTCPRDGVPLVPANPYDVRDYDLELSTFPGVVRAGEPATLVFRIFHPGTGEEVRNLVTVHDRRYHLFVVSQDMEHFEHLHPQQRPDGSWSIEVTLPKAGYYKIFSDFVPNGGSAQFIPRPLVTAGYGGDLAGDAAHLVADAAPTLESGGMTARVSHDPQTFVSGLYGHLRFELTETDTGRPVTDLQPYLGSFGHMVIMSEDLVHYVHSHPLDLENSDEDTGPLALMIPVGVDPSRLRAGPVITFEGLMPKPGLYRAWAQFRRRGEVHTFAHTFAVHAAG